MILLLLPTLLAGPPRAFWVIKVQILVSVGLPFCSPDSLVYWDLGTSYEQVLEDIYEYNSTSSGPQGLLQGGFVLEMLHTRFVDSCLII